MIIQSVKIKGSRIIGKTVEITLNAKLNHIDCDMASLKIVKNALASFFHPESALNPQLWNKKDFESDSCVEIKVMNQPKKLIGFYKSAILTLVRKINHANIFIIDDQNKKTQLPIQQFLDRVSYSGITLPIALNTNDENIVSWIDGKLIQTWSELSFADLWDFINIGIICNDKYKIIHEFMQETRQTEVKTMRTLKIMQEETMQKIRDSQELLTNVEEFSFLYNKAKNLKAIIAADEVNQYSEEISRLALEESQIMKDIFKLEQKILSISFLKDKVDQNADALYKLEHLKLTFENEINEFDYVETLSDDMHYNNHLQDLQSNICSYNKCLIEYQRICEKCIRTEEDILNCNFLLENEKSKVTAINLNSLISTDALNEFKESFDPILNVFVNTMDSLEQKYTEAKEQKESLLIHNNADKMIEELRNIDFFILNAKLNVRSVSDEISKCYKEILTAKIHKIELEQKIQAAKTFISVSSSIDISYINGLKAFEELLEDLTIENSPLLKKFICLLVRELTLKDIYDHPFVMECELNFIKIVVKDKESVQAFLTRLRTSPGTNFEFISLEEFNSSFKDNLPVIKRAHHREIQSVEHFIESRSQNSLVKELHRSVLFVPKSYDGEIFDPKIIKRNLYTDENIFEENNGCCGAGHVFSNPKKIQQHIINYLDGFKTLRLQKEIIATKMKELINLKEKFKIAAYETSFPFNCNGKSLMELLDLMDIEFMCLRERNTQKMKYNILKYLIDWLKNDSQIQSYTKEESYNRQKELEAKISRLQFEYKKILQEQTQLKQRLTEWIIEIMKDEHKLHVKYDFGRYFLIEIDAAFTEEVKLGLKQISNAIKESRKSLDNKMVHVKQLLESQTLKLSAKQMESTESQLYHKRLMLKKILNKISIINTTIDQITQDFSEIKHHTKRQLLQEFPSHDVRIAELVNLQCRLQNFDNFMSPNQIVHRVASLKGGIQKFETRMKMMKHWPTGFLENIFIMQDKASCHALSSIFTYARTLSSLILPNNAFLHMWLVTDDQKLEKFDLMSVREICYAIKTNRVSLSIHFPKEMVMFLIIHSICCVFETPFVILDDIYGMFDRQYWEMISTILKVLSEKQQIIVVKNVKDKIMTEKDKPDKIILVNAASNINHTTTNDKSLTFKEHEMYNLLCKSAQNMSLY